MKIILVRVLNQQILISQILIKIPCAKLWKRKRKDTVMGKPAAVLKQFMT